MKTYPLDIQELREFQGGHLGWHNKGHHDRRVFAALVFLASREDGQMDPLPTHRIRHEYWRCVPVGNGERGTLIVPAKAGARGAFPVTVVED